MKQVSTYLLRKIKRIKSNDNIVIKYLIICNFGNTWDMILESNFIVLLKVVFKIIIYTFHSTTGVREDG